MSSRRMSSDSAAPRSVTSSRKPLFNHPHQLTLSPNQERTESRKRARSDSIDSRISARSNDVFWKSKPSVIERPPKISTAKNRDFNFGQGPSRDRSYSEFQNERVPKRMLPEITATQNSPKKFKSAKLTDGKRKLFESTNLSYHDCERQYHSYQDRERSSSMLTQGSNPWRESLNHQFPSERDYPDYSKRPGILGEYPGQHQDRYAPTLPNDFSLSSSLPEFASLSKEQMNMLPRNLRVQSRTRRDDEEILIDDEDHLSPSYGRPSAQRCSPLFNAPMYRSYGFHPHHHSLARQDYRLPPPSLFGSRGTFDNFLSNVSVSSCSSVSKSRAGARFPSERGRSMEKGSKDSWSYDRSTNWPNSFSSSGFFSRDEEDADDDEADKSDDDVFMEYSKDREFKTPKSFCPKTTTTTAHNPIPQTIRRLPNISHLKRLSMERAKGQCDVIDFSRRTKSFGEDDCLIVENEDKWRVIENPNVMKPNYDASLDPEDRAGRDKHRSDEDFEVHDLKRDMKVSSNDEDAKVTDTARVTIENSPTVDVALSRPTLTSVPPSPEGQNLFSRKYPAVEVLSISATFENRDKNRVVSPVESEVAGEIVSGMPSWTNEEVSPISIGSSSSKFYLESPSSVEENDKMEMVVSKVAIDELDGEPFPASKQDGYLGPFGSEFDLMTVFETPKVKSNLQENDNSQDDVSQDDIKTFCIGDDYLLDDNSTSQRTNFFERKFESNASSPFLSNTHEAGGRNVVEVASKLNQTYDSMVDYLADRMNSEDSEKESRHESGHLAFQMDSRPNRNDEAHDYFSDSLSDSASDSASSFRERNYSATHLDDKDYFYDGEEDYIDDYYDNYEDEDYDDDDDDDDDDVQILDGDDHYVADDLDDGNITEVLSSDDAEVDPPRHYVQDLDVEEGHDKPVISHRDLVIEDAKKCVYDLCVYVGALNEEQRKSESSKQADKPKTSKTSIESQEELEDEVLIFLSEIINEVDPSLHLGPTHAESYNKIFCKVAIGPPNEVLASDKSLEVNINRGSFSTLIEEVPYKKLTAKSHVNDEIINSYMSLIRHRSSKYQDLPKVFTFSTFFFESLRQGGHDRVKRWTRGIDIFQYDMIMIPLNFKTEHHWALFIIDLATKVFVHYDSLLSRDINKYKHLKLTKNVRVINLFRDYLAKEHSQKKSQYELNLKSFKVDFCSRCPQQRNLIDCGLFCMRFAEGYTRRGNIDFCQAEMLHFRKQICLELLNLEIPELPRFYCS